ncbi:unnamed protein product [Cylindrotheca closterium]|uniref:non-specific serine/threonine protein kinase n=1 Tax=Cylindrotheca closterium TaxID=2856 RepID=A0AAD2G2J4_9STRA|nr:unnamed protein product [Cylindrotheca closterium]
MSGRKTNEERQQEVDRQLALMKAAIGDEDIFDSDSSDSDSDDSGQLRQRSNTTRDAVASARRFLMDDDDDYDDAIVLGFPRPMTPKKSPAKLHVKMAAGMGNQGKGARDSIWDSVRSDGSEQSQQPQSVRQSLSNLFLQSKRPSAKRLGSPGIWNDADATEGEEFIQENSKSKFSYLACMWGTVLWLIALGSLFVFGYYIYDFGTSFQHAPAPIESPAEEHSEDSKAALMKHGVLTEAVLDDPNSPQAAALRWIEENSSQASSNKHNPYLAQRYALAVVYYSMDGQHWTNSDGWLSNEGYCKWYGVQCLGTEGSIEKHFGNGPVFELNLSSNEVKGTIPVELNTFKDLFFLDLQDNALEGTIPDELGGWSALRMFSIAHNDLYGSIPPTLLSTSADLRVLNAGHNGFTGTIPPELGTATKLREIRLEYNSLYGHIPDSVRDLDRMETLHLAGNKLGGSLPSGIYDMARLEALYLHDNSLTGHLSNNFASLSHLELLTLNHNQLVGTIPNVFANSRHLQEVHLHGNELSGNMPRSVCSLTTEHKLTYLSATCTQTKVEGEMGVHCECCTDCK